jgi:uncharacterized protein (DUF697 family)
MIGYEDLDTYDGYRGYAGTTVREPSAWVDRSDWLGVRQEVETEARAEIVLLGLGNAGKSTLFNSLRGWPVTLTALKLGRQAEPLEERMGLFTLVDLPRDGDRNQELLLDRLERAALLIYVLDGAIGCARQEPTEAVVRLADRRWIGRLQAMGCPLLVALNKADLWDGQLSTVLASIEGQLGLEVVPVSAYDTPEVQCRFLDRMIEACPRLAVPLGREVAAFRRAAAQRIIRRAATLCGVVAMEPIPLVDLPMQVGTQVGLVARIATMYGHPPTSDHSRELVLTGAGSAALRLVALEVAKLVPVLGWAVSGLLGAATTWLLGQTVLAYFEGRAAPNGLREVVVDEWEGLVLPRCQRAFDFLIRLRPGNGMLRKGAWPWRRDARRET